MSARTRRRHPRGAAGERVARSGASSCGLLIRAVFCSIIDAEAFSFNHRADAVNAGGGRQKIRAAGRAAHRLTGSAGRRRTGKRTPTAYDTRVD